VSARPSGKGGLNFKNLDSTGNKTQYFSITKINCLILHKQIIAVDSDNYTMITDTLHPSGRAV
jgi:hypothetical protein